MNRKTVFVWSLVLVPVIVGCANVASDEQARASALDVMRASFKTRGIASIERLNQDETQALCSRYATSLPKDIAQKIEAANLATIKYPVNGKYLGDWREGEKIAQSGRGLQFNETRETVAGGNCYACHQLAPQELAYGSIGPSLYRFGKLRGFGEETQKYAWAKIWNSESFSACSTMPRFGHQGILTEDQVRHLVALLVDPESPVNK